jgi:hypothetical protein
MIINDSLENYTPSATRYEASELFTIVVDVQV